MREANQATFLIAEQTAKLNLKVPVEVAKLDYYGREIEILAITEAFRQNPKNWVEFL